MYPYFRKESISQGYCSLVQPLKGNGVSDTFKKMLMEIDQVSESIADAIIQSYSHLKDLLKAYQKCISTTQGELLLENIQVKRNKSTKKLGKTLSKRIYCVFIYDNANKKMI